MIDMWDLFALMSHCAMFSLILSWVHSRAQNLSELLALLEIETVLGEKVSCLARQGYLNQDT